MEYIKTQWIYFLNHHPRKTIFITFFSIYTLCTFERLQKASNNNHFAYLAQSLMAGQTSLLNPPPHGNDWASYEVLTLKGKALKRVQQKSSSLSNPIKGVYRVKRQPKGRQNYTFQTLNGSQLRIYPSDIIKRERRYFVSFPPFPSILLLPLVYFFGLAASDVWLTLFFAAFNALLAYELFKLVYSTRRQQVASTPKQTKLLEDDTRNALWLTASLGLGTAHFWCAVRGEVWYTALIIGLSCQLLFFKYAWHLRNPLLAGLAYAAAFSTRASLITLALFAYIQVFSSSVHPHFKERVKKLVYFSIPPLTVGIVLLYYNYIRFEKLHEFGHRYLAGGQLQRIAEYGLFHWVFLKKNLIAAFLLLPKFSFSLPILIYSWHGMAIQFSSPQLLWSFLPPLKTTHLSENKSHHPKHIFQFITDSNIHRTGLYLVLISTFTLLIFYQNTGWVQYSWRFVIDLLPALFLLFVINGRTISLWLKLAIIWGILINLFGAIAFGRSSLWWEGLNLPQLLPH